MPAVNKVPVERVKQLLAQGCTQQQVAIRLGVNKTSVCIIAKQMGKEATS